MRAPLNEPVCPVCAGELLIRNGEATCVNDCPLDPDLPWNRTMQQRIDEIVSWLKSGYTGLGS